MIQACTPLPLTTTLSMRKIEVPRSGLIKDANMHSISRNGLHGLWDSHLNRQDARRRNGKTGVRMIYVSQHQRINLRRRGMQSDLLPNLSSLTRRPETGGVTVSSLLPCKSFFTVRILHQNPVYYGRCSVKYFRPKGYRICPGFWIHERPWSRRVIRAPYCGCGGCNLTY